MRGTLSRDLRKSKQNSDAEKDAFLAVVSHELRNQINMIYGWAALMRKSAPDGETLARGLTVIERNASLQAQLIEQLIDLSRVRINSLKPKTEKMLLVPILEIALDSMVPLASAKGVLISSHLNGPRDTVKVDAGLLQQAITNILANAIKFTPDGGRIDLRLITRGKRAEITISDNGCGISPDLLHLVFEPFKQVHSNNTNNTGLGLGLTIAHHIIAAHKGAICVSSPGEGRGTNVIVTLPVENSEN